MANYLLIQCDWARPTHWHGDLWFGQPILIQFDGHIKFVEVECNDCHYHYKQLIHTRSSHPNTFDLHDIYNDCNTCSSHINTFDLHGIYNDCNTCSSHINTFDLHGIYNDCNTLWGRRWMWFNVAATYVVRSTLRSSLPMGHPIMCPSIDWRRAAATSKHFPGHCLLSKK